MFTAWNRWLAAILALVLALGGLVDFSRECESTPIDAIHPTAGTGGGCPAPSNDGGDPDEGSRHVSVHCACACHHAPFVAVGVIRTNIAVTGFLNRPTISPLVSRMDAPRLRPPIAA